MLMEKASRILRIRLVEIKPADLEQVMSVSCPKCGIIRGREVGLTLTAMQSARTFASAHRFVRGGRATVEVKSATNSCHESSKCL